MPDCKNIQLLVAECLLTKQDLSQHIRTHIASCTACSKFTIEYSKMFETLETFSSPEPPPQLIDGTMLKIHEESVRMREKSCWWKTGLAATGVLPLVISINLVWIYLLSGSIELISPSWAINAKWVVIPFILLGLSLVYGALPVLVGKYLTLQRR